MCGRCWGRAVWGTLPKAITFRTSASGWRDHKCVFIFIRGSPPDERVHPFRQRTDSICGCGRLDAGALGAARYARSDGDEIWLWHGALRRLHSASRRQAGQVVPAASHQRDAGGRSTHRGFARAADRGRRARSPAHRARGRERALPGDGTTDPVAPHRHAAFGRRGRVSAPGRTPPGGQAVTQIKRLALLLAVGACQKASPAAPPLPEVTVLTVQSQTVPAKFEWVAEAAASKSVEVRAQVSGVVVARPY